MKRIIHLKDLKISCIIGILDRERVEPQNLFVDINLDYDYRESTQTEDIHKTLDYAELAEMISDFIIHRKFYLLETLAEETTTLLFSKWEKISKIKMTIKKPAAVPQASYAAVTLEKEAH